MSKEVVLDIETQTASLADLSQMRVSVVGAYFYDTDSFETFEENQLAGLFKRL